MSSWEEQGDLPLDHALLWGGEGDGRVCVLAEQALIGLQSIHGTVFYYITLILQQCVGQVAHTCVFVYTCIRATVRWQC